MSDRYYVQMRCDLPPILSENMDMNAKIKDSAWAFYTEPHNGISDVNVRRIGGGIDSVLISTIRPLTDDEMQAVFEMVAKMVGVTP